MLCTLLGVVVLVLAVVGVAWFVPWGDDEAAPPAAPAQTTAVRQPVNLAGLPESTTHDTVAALPLDSGPLAPTDGAVVHPRQEVAVFATPDGPPLARIGPRQVGDTWLPVIAEQPGWVRVLLPSRPNGSTGWLASEGLDRARTPYLIRVHLRSMSMELLRNSRLLGKWTIGIGKRSAPTPTGRTFLLGSFSDRHQDYSPVILPLGTHSPTLDSFGGGPGTVAIHTWPTDDVFGTRSSDGCIRVPPDALEQLTEVPLGTLVLIDEE
ncbi:MAG: L,D-transpeptidase [Pseudonocardiaceae bacterium]